MDRKIIPASMAVPKLSKVPIRMYSVSFRSFDFFKSPNLKTDFAASKKPTASQCPVAIKEKTNSRSRVPIYLPASWRD